MDREHIVSACNFIIENKHSIPRGTVEFIRDAALCAFDSLSDDYCKKCHHNGKQMVYPSACTGCGADGEKRNFKLSTPSRSPS